MASKKLVIKGADFSENGFVFQTITKEITTLKTAQNVEYVYGSSIPSSDATYLYERQGFDTLQRGYSFSTYLTNPGPDVDYIDVEDYTKVTVKSIIGNLVLSGYNGYGIILGFLDSNKKLIGGISAAPVNATGYLCEGVGTSDDLREFTRDIPSGCKYLCATAKMSSTYTEGEKFKITLSKTVIV